MKKDVNKSSVILFSTILTLSTTATKNYKSITSLFFAEKQSITIEIGRLFIVDLKGAVSSDVIEYNTFTVTMIDLLFGFSNKLVSFSKKIGAKCLKLSCFKKY